MISDKLKELESLRAKAAELEAAVQKERAQQLANLPKQYGFSDVEEFVDAVLAASGTRRGRRGRPPATGRSANRAGKKSRAPRTKITDETRAEVKKLVENGKTGAEIAEIVGISLPSVQNIKKALGLVKTRK